ncbi:MAG: plasmid replication/partition related protein, partial [Methylocystaceae bacterium]|nr:plasmid replication/partition related protein [Methylocystaceae bacterium]
MSDEYEFHPIADLFPLIEGEEFEALCADIKKNGLRQNIMIYQGKILDGRNRYRACKAVGEELRTLEFLGADPYEYVAAQ